MLHDRFWSLNDDVAEYLVEDTAKKYFPQVSINNSSLNVCLFDKDAYLRGIIEKWETQYCDNYS